MSDGMSEDHQARFAGAVALSEYFASWDHACAFTGEPLHDLIDADPGSALLRLAPHGELRADLILPACKDAAHAYRELALAVAADLALLVKLGAMRDSGLLQRLNASGQLRLPRDTAFYPNRLLLQEHRRALGD